jgi:translocation and assembly module TamB
MAFMLAFALGAALHLDVPRARRVVTEEVNRVLAPSFPGHIRIDHVGRLGIFGLSGARATIEDPSGRPVLAVTGVRVQVAAWTALRSALFNRTGPITIELSNLSIDALDVRLDTDASGKLDLLSAFESRGTGAPPDPNGRGVRLVLSHIALRSAWGHGQMSGAPFLDVQLDELLASFAYAPDLLEADISRATVAARRIANGADVDGSLEAHLRKPSDPKLDMGAHVSWRGTVGSVAHSILVSLDHRELDALVEFPDAEPKDIRTLWPESPIGEHAHAQLEARGTLPDIKVDLQASLGQAALAAKGHLFLGDDERAQVDLSARDIDLHEFAAEAPRTRLALSGDVSAAKDTAGALRGNLVLHLLGGRVGPDEVPAASIRARASHTDDQGWSALGEVDVHEPAAPTHLTARLSARGDSSVVAFDLDTNAAELDRIGLLHHVLRGSLRASAKGAVDVGHKTIDARLEARASDLAIGGTTVQSASLDALAFGPMAVPSIDLALRSQNLVVAGLHLSSAYVLATGNATTPHVTVSTRGPDTPDLDATADLGMQTGVSVSGLSMSLARAGERATITADKIGLAGDGMRVDEARVEGVGSPATATLMASHGALRVRASTEGIDLARVGRLVHVENKLKGGTLSFDVDAILSRHQAQGRGDLDLSRAAVGSVRDLSAQLRVQLEGRKFVGEGRAQAAGIGYVHIRAPRLELGGARPLSAAAWREAWGDVTLDAQADLAKVAGLFPPGQFPFSEARGSVTLRGHLARDDIHDLTPDLNVLVSSQGLVLAPETTMTRDIDGVLVMQPPPWRMAGIDFDVDAFIDGDTGLVRFSTRAHDVKGEIGQLRFGCAHVPFADLFHDTGRLSADLRTTPFDLQVTVAPRHLGSLPAILKQPYAGGTLQGNLKVEGTLLAPTLDLAATLRKSRFSGASGSVPLDVDLSAHYAGTQGIASVKVLSSGSEVLDAEASVDAAIARLVEEGGSTARWKASGRAHFTDFPLEAIAPLDDKLVAGKLTGDVSLVDLHEDAHADMALFVDSFRVGSIGYKSARLEAKADGSLVEGSVRIDQTDGVAETRAHAGLTWGAALAPTLEPSQPLDITLSAKNFRIAALLPFVEDTLDELDGRLDANTRLELDPQSRGARLSGNVALRRGLFEAAAGGGGFHDIAADVRFSPDGVITLEKLTASGSTGKIKAAASARLEGIHLQSAKGVIVIPSGAPIPLSAGGAQIGNIDGRFDVSQVTSAGGATDVRVEVSHLRVALPEGSSSQAQSLGSVDKVRIGAHQGNAATFVVVPLGPVKKAEGPSSHPSTESRIETHLADVQVVRGTDLKVDLDGRVNVKLDGKSQVTGQINLKKGGTLSIQGKNFTVESGNVTFVGGEPSNPEVVVKASWTAPDGTVVYANFVGPLKTGKVTLTSEPTLPQQEIVQLLLFGTAAGQQAQTPSGTPANGALGTVGGEAAQPLNHALNQLGLGAVSTRIDTTQSSNPKPEVEVQIARDISVQIAVVLGQPPPGVNPDHTLLTVDWRFLSKWSLASTLGDAGTTIFDLLWQTRY